jgi:NitT/TauT family transport system substrate-binding protein
MVQEAGGHVLVDEADLWPDGEFVTTHLIVATSFLEQHPDAVKNLLEAQVEANDFVNDQPDESQEIVRNAIAELTGVELDAGIVAAAWDRLTFTNDPIAASLAQSAGHAQELGLLDQRSFDGIYDLTLLNEVLAEGGLDAIPQP